MAAFEAAERDVDRRRKLIAGRPDEDGFITVVPKGRGRSKAEKAAAAASAGPDAWGYMSTNRKSKAKKAALEDTDFYSFQKRESKISGELSHPIPFVLQATSSGRLSANA